MCELTLHLLVEAPPPVSSVPLAMDTPTSLLSEVPGAVTTRGQESGEPAALVDEF